jgi:predicted alpha/beta superfamily hydrolase
MLRLLLLLIITTPLHLCSQTQAPRADISIGEKIELRSTILDETREIYVYQPEGFWGMDDSLTNLPVIIVLDGESQFRSTVAIVDYLSAAPFGTDIMPRSVVVGIPNTNRTRDLTPVKGIIGTDSTSLDVTGGGKQFLRFIRDELIPHIDSSYSTSDHRTLIGHSMGGLLTFEALLRARSYFDNYIVIDPGFGFAQEAYMQEVIDSLSSGDFSQETVFYAAANTSPTFLDDYDLAYDSSDVMTLIDIPNRKFMIQADTSDWNVNLHTVKYDDENHFSVPLVATQDAFKTIYDYYSFPTIMDYYHPRYADKTDLMPRLVNHYNMISEKMGHRVVPMMGYINSFAFGIAESGRTDLAEELFRFNIEMHPDDAIAYSNLAYYFKTQGQVEVALDYYRKSLKLLDQDWVRSAIHELLDKQRIELER